MDHRWIITELDDLHAELIMAFFLLLCIIGNFHSKVKKINRINVEKVILLK